MVKNMFLFDKFEKTDMHHVVTLFPNKGPVPVIYWCLVNMYSSLSGHCFKVPSLGYVTYIVSVPDASHVSDQLPLASNLAP